MEDRPFESSDSADDGLSAVVSPKKKQQSDKKGKGIPRYNVVLWDSDDHTYDYVEQMLRELFGYDSTECLKLAESVDNDGRAVVITTTQEHAELKRDQIHAYGKDRIEGSKGSMWATIEAVE